MKIINKLMRKLKAKGLNAKGEEVPDKTPACIPIGYKNPPTLAEKIKSMVKNELRIYAVHQGQETFEEADDFNIGDDVDPTSPYEDLPDGTMQEEEPVEKPVKEKKEPADTPATPPPAEKEKEKAQLDT